MNSDRSSRRDFVTDVGRLASVVALTGCATAPAVQALAAPASRPSATGEWDLSWIDRVRSATNRAIFDWPGLGDPENATIMQLADRYLGNCDSAYGPGRHTTQVVLNIRTQAVPAALNDAAWERHALGVEYSVKDPTTKLPAVRNPFWYRAPSPVPDIVLPSIEDLVARGAIVLVCDFALGHLAKRLATKAGRDAADVHRELRSSFIRNAHAVPSGIFGLAQAQNAGCALVHL